MMVETRRSAFTQAQEDYLKALYHLGGDSRPVHTGELAERLTLSPASVSEMVGRLSEQGLVSHGRYQGQQLTAEGKKAALELVRHHRLLEMFLVKILGYEWDEVHDEAERLEHFISERMEERIFDLLGRPELDPHGHAIPSRDGVVNAASERPLGECHAGERVVIRFVSDDQAERLRELKRRGLMPGTRLTIVAGSAYESPIEADTEDGHISVPLGLAKAVFVDEVAGG